METGIVKLTPELLEIISGSGSNSALEAFRQEIFLLNVIVAGTSYCESIEEIAPRLAEGTLLKMIRDPHNKYDKRAIGIYFEAKRIGWVPARMNEVVSHLMDAGKALFARVRSVEEVGQWIEISADIFMID